MATLHHRKPADDDTEYIPLHIGSFGIGGISEPIGLGVPQAKSRFDWLDFVSLLLSLFCLAISAATISPRLSLGWWLGYTNQLILIGLLLSIMNLCIKRLGPPVFILVEARFGRSTLQNYDAILRNSVTESHTSWAWRFILMFLIVLPLGLGVAYKRFLGTTTQPLETLRFADASYGLAGPPGLDLGGYGSIYNVGITFMVNASIPFMTATIDDTPGAFTPSYPQAYGFNTLHLGDGIVAALDAPWPQYVTSIQQSLHVGEEVYLTAAVQGTVSRYNSSTYFDKESLNNWGSIMYQYLYNGFELALYTPGLVQADNSWSYIAILPEGVQLVDAVNNGSKSIWLFTTTRQYCQGTWTLTSTSIQLTSGYCNDTQAYPLYGNIDLDLGEFELSILSEYIGPFSTTRNQSTMALSTMAMCTANMHWSRYVALRTSPDQFDPRDNPWPYIKYHVDDQVSKRKITLSSSWLLFTIVGVQPIMALVFYILGRALHSTPLDRSFGTTAILAGVDRASLNILRGASLSGKLRKPVRLRIDVRHSDDTGMTGRIEYTLDGKGENGTLNGAELVE